MLCLEFSEVYLRIPFLDSYFFFCLNFPILNDLRFVKAKYCLKFYNSTINLLKISILNKLKFTKRFSCYITFRVKVLLQTKIIYY